MRIKVYQINGELDSQRLKFFGYKTALKDAGGIDPGIHRTVFDGDVDCSDLEEVYITHSGGIDPAAETFM